MYDDHESDADCGEGDNHPRWTDALEFSFFLKVLAEPKDDETTADREGDKTNEKVIGVGHGWMQSSL